VSRVLISTGKRLLQRQPNEPLNHSAQKELDARDDAAFARIDRKIL
jgi:hypothetical protein